MNKPDGLRRLLLAAIPALRDAPDRLEMHVDKGTIAARAGATLSFEYRYQLAILVTEYAGSTDALVIPILAWITEMQPDLLRRDDQEPFGFEAEIMDGDVADIEIRIDLTERVRVTVRDDGGYDVSHAEPDALDLDRFPGVCTRLLQGFLGDELVAPPPPIE